MPAKRRQKCVVENCNVREGSGKTMFGFPPLEDIDRRSEWCCRLGTLNIGLPVKARVCQLHFNNGDLLRCGKKISLRPNALPRQECLRTSEPSRSPEMARRAEDSSSAKSTSDGIRPEHATPASSRSTTKTINTSLEKTFVDTSGTATTTDSASLFSQENLLRKQFHANQSNENYLDPDDNRLFLISEEKLRLLLRRCIKCGCILTNDAALYSLGVDLHIEMYCDSCGILKWHSFSQSEEERIQTGNGLLSAAVLVSGNTYEGISNIANNLNLKIMSPSTYHRVLNNCAYTVIDEEYTRRQQELIDDLLAAQMLGKNEDLSLAIDGRFSQPGYTATYGVVSAMDITRHKIIDSLILKKNDDEINCASHMKVVGARRLLEALTDPCDNVIGNDDLSEELMDVGESDGSLPVVTARKCLRIQSVATDDSRAVIKMMKDCFPAIQHVGDAWYLLKSVRKRLEMIAQKASCKELGPWIKNICNFLWGKIVKCAGDEDTLIEQWRSIVYHVFDKHSWSDDGTFEQLPCCSHTTAQNTKIQYLRRGTRCEKELQNLVDDVDLQRRIRRCARFLQTSHLESYHAVLVKYVPKRLSFGDRGYRSRVHLAILDWNNNIQSCPSTNDQDEEMFRFSIPASTAAWRLKKRTAPHSYEWSISLVKKIMESARAYRYPAESADARPAFSERYLVDSFGRPNREVLMEQYRIRRSGLAQHIDEVVCTDSDISDDEEDSDMSVADESQYETL